MHELAPLLDRLEALANHAASPRDRSALLGDMEDALSAGYARALAGEAELCRLEERLDALIDRDGERRPEELVEVLREHRALERSIVRLRTLLSHVHRDFVVLGGDRLTSR